MKKTIALMLLVCVGSVFAGYTHTIGSGDDTSLSLNGHESLLMTGGELYHLNLFEWSSARIEDTAPLVSEDNGGIWLLGMGGYSTLEILGGDIHQFDIGSSAYATISGGSIDELWSYQDVGVRWIEGTDPPEYEADTHITFICDVDSIDLTGNLLTGNWLDGSGFSIQLVDVNGYDPAIENIQFIPEPASMLLLGLGGLLIRRKK